MSTELATTERAELRADRAAFEPADFPEALRLAASLVKSGLMPKALNTPEAVVTAIVMGRELGLTAMQAVRSIHVIEGKPSMSSALIVGLVKKAADVCEYFRLVESTDAVAKYETRRKGDPAPTTMAFTIEQARAAGVTGKDNWRKYPAAMLRARCETALARAVYPDLVMGLYDPDEIETEPRDVTPRRRNTAEPPPAAGNAPPPTDWAAEIANAATVEALAETWKRMPKAEHATHKAAKDTRKAALEAPRVPEVVPPPAHDAETGEVRLSEEAAAFIASVKDASGLQGIGFAAEAWAAAAPGFSPDEQVAAFAALLARCQTRADFSVIAPLLDTVRKALPGAIAEALTTAYRDAKMEAK